MNIPVMYNYINAVNSQISPSTVHCTNVGLQRFFARYLLQKAIAVFKWELPDSWEENYFLYTLYCYGFIAIINTDKFGVIPQMCSLQGYGVFYQPTNVVITNPLLKGILTPRIGVQTTLIRLQPDYGGIMDMVNFYADMMAVTAETAGINIFNSKLSYVFASENKTLAETAKKMFDKVASGEPATFTDTKMFNADGTPKWQMLTQNVGQNYIAGELLADLRKWEQKFLNEIGIPTANTEKKERLITDEANKNEVERQTLAGMWLEQLQKGCKLASKMFHINISVDWRFKQNESNNNNTGAV